MRAWRTDEGAIRLGGAPTLHLDKTLLLPCGKCAGCRTSEAKSWALRCTLELQEHRKAAFTTLTYDDRWLPPTLEKRHLQLFFKRLRKKMGPNRPIRFFASGEYGEQTHRPHYHAILYGISESEKAIIQDHWKYGHARTTGITPARIAYTAGYTAKKLSDRERKKEERVDPSTGEVYQWQPPFLQMSRRPGIGGEARKYAASWRSYALLNGTKQPVPRFLHEAWKKQATPEQIEKLALEKKERIEQLAITLQMLAANEEIEIAKQALKACRRKY